MKELKRQLEIEETSLVKFAEVAVVILMIFLVLSSILEVTGTNRRASEFLMEWHTPINLRVDIENFFRALFQTRSIDRVIRDLNRYADSFSDKFEFPIPMRVAFSVLKKKQYSRYDH